MNPQFLRVRNRLINVNSISYIRIYEDMDRLDIRLMGPTHEISSTVTVEGEEALPVRQWLASSGMITDLRPKG